MFGPRGSVCNEVCPGFWHTLEPRRSLHEVRSGDACAAGAVVVTTATATAASTVVREIRMPPR